MYAAKYRRFMTVAGCSITAVDYISTLFCLMPVGRGGLGVRESGCCRIQSIDE